MAEEGEERLSTLFADVHYWFGQPSARPASHRFDKESYVYLYRNTSTSRGRLEIANHAGTPEQDAFTGYLDNAKVSQSHRHPSLVTIVVDGSRSDHPGPAQNTDWRLPSTDPRDEGKYLFRLHTLDIYFWVKEDATLFVQHCQHTLRAQQLELDYPVTEPHSNLTSPVVQKLENMAVSDPAYSNSRQSLAKSVEPAQPTSSADSRNSSQPTPMPYNPAAPAAPEKRTHREKTPPPPPEEPGLGLSHAAKEDHSHPPSTPVGVNQAQPTYQHNQTSLSSHSDRYTPASAYSGLSSPSASTAPTSHSYAPPPKDSSTSLAGHPNLDSPTVQILGQSYMTSPTVPLQHLQPQYPDYLAQRQSASPHEGHSSAPSYSYYPTSTGDTSIHSQVYIPTEAESHGKKPKPATAGSGDAGPGKWEQKAEKAEKGLNRLLRKVEKKIG